MRHAGACALGSMLAANTSLAALEVWDCTIGDAGAASIATALRANAGSALRSLDLSSNELGGRGAQALAAMLVGNQTVASLDVRCNAFLSPTEVKLCFGEALRSDAVIANLMVYDGIFGTNLATEKRREYLRQTE